MLQRGVMTMPADVYSFAMLMLELWVGDIVYKGINSHQVRTRHTAKQHPSASCATPDRLTESAQSSVDCHGYPFVTLG